MYITYVYIKIMKLHISTIFSFNAWYKIEYIHLHVNEQWNCENKDSRSIVIDKKNLLPID